MTLEDIAHVTGQDTRLSVMQRWEPALPSILDSSLERWRVTFFQRCSIWDGHERESVYSPCSGGGQLDGVVSFFQRC